MNIQSIGGGAPQMGRLYSEKAAADGFQAALESAGRKNDAVELRKACEGFESYLLQTMFREMRKTGFREGGIFSKSNAEEIFEDMLYEEYSKTAAAKGGVGLAGMMFRQMASINLSNSRSLT